MSKDTKEIQLSEEEYANLERLAKEHNITVDEAMEVAILLFFHEADVKYYDEAKQALKPHVLKVVEQQIIELKKAGI